MRLLFVDAYHQYLNPTSGLLPLLIATAAPDMACYGPGFSSDAELSQGIRAYVERTGPYDGVVLGLHIPIFAEDEARLHHSARFVQRYNAFGSSVETLLPFFRDVLAHIRTLPIRHRFISLLNFDYYCTTTQHTDIFESLDAHVITPGAQFAPTLDEIPNWAWQERHFVRKESKISNAWIEYLLRRPDRVLSLPHFVAESEFSLRTLTDRRHRVSIPGVQYLKRKEGRSALAKRGLRPARSPVFGFVRFANRLGIHVFANYLMLKAYHAEYQGNLIDTRFVYTAREGFGIPVRKFFEIPAAGALMMCVSPHGFAELGFRDGKNFLEVDSEALPDTIAALEADLDRAQAIASAGRKLVFERHSLAVRSRQLALCLKAIGEGCFAGSAWKAGEFEVLERSAGLAGMQAKIA